MSNRKLTSLVIVWGMCILAANGQVMINEFCASNSTIAADPDYNDYADWIELFNGGETILNLKGYYLTDDLSVPGKWQIPGDAMIEPGGTLVIWADGMDAGLHASFKLSALGEEIGLYSPGLVLLDSITYAEQKVDISFGRITDGHMRWGFFQQPTPDASNSTQPAGDFVSSVPEFSVRGGIYTGALSVELKTDLGGEIRFTTDGSEPVSTSTLYSSPIAAASTTIVRARIFQPGLIPGPTVTNSYFINENSVEGKLPVISIATAPENFWDPVEGIYVQDFKPLWEIPVNIELFENNGSDRAAFNQPAGAKVNGLYAWQLPQKMLGIYFKKQYGSGHLQYPVIHQRQRNSYKSFALRASGSDWSFTLFRDMLGQHATLLNMDLDIMGFRPSVVYVNGEYMGIHNIREKVDDDYIEKSYLIEPGTFDLVENENYAEAGNLEASNQLKTMLAGDLSVSANYNAVAEIVDIENLTDYLITEMATGNTSVDHNVMTWKPRDEGKWKWVVMDLDRGFFNPSGNLLDFYLSKKVLHLNDLFRNPTYKSYFAGRLAAQLYTGFNPQRMNQLIDQHVSYIESEISSHISRWAGTTSSYGNAIPSVQYWQNEVCKVRAFVQERPGALLNDLQNYGFSGTANLALSTSPANAGTIRIDGLVIPGATWSGPYLRDLEFQLRAEGRPGHQFMGWMKSVKQVIIPMGSTWKYADTGVDPGTGWKSAGYNDAAWKSGAAQLGYGDGDESTTVGFGGDSQNKFITTYFRKVFTLTAEDLKAGQFAIGLLKDDGAVVYLNGTEIARANMGCGTLGYGTLASTAISGSSESTVSTFYFDRSLLHAGENLIAVEVHQGEATSSDLSFDLEFSGYHADTQSYLSTNPVITMSLTEDINLTAQFQQTSNCILPDTIDTDLTLGAECSPYLAQGDITIDRNAILTIEPGVEIWMPEGASIFVSGAINAAGNSREGIVVRLNPEYAPGSWGVITFRSPSLPSSLSYLTLEDASKGPDPVLDIGAISAFHADLEMDHMVLVNNYGNPIVARYSDVKLSHSTLHSKITGDLINVKYGHAEISNCRFTGNDRPDTDAIDYDEIENGIIRNCQITDFLGYNSDAVDLGENATGIMIDSLFVYHITDKGVSVGQHSTATIEHSVFVNCNMGVGVKDSALVIIDHSVFYGNGYGVACFEKNLGYAGGNARITNSILSNSTRDPLFVDAKSTMLIHHSLTDSLVLPYLPSNLTGNPLFAGPSFSDFALLPGSPALNAGADGTAPADMGIPYNDFRPEPSVMIYQLYLSAGTLGLPEFITLYNPSSAVVDLSGYSFTKGVTMTIPEGISLDPLEILYITSDASLYDWHIKTSQVLQWESGKLANEGEEIQLEDAHGIVIDHIAYRNDGFWPPSAFSGDLLLQLIDPGLDNHFPESWQTAPVQQVITSSPDGLIRSNLRLYPNPARSLVTIEGIGEQIEEVGIYNLTGQLLGLVNMEQAGRCTLDVSAYQAGMLFIKVGDQTLRLVVTH